MRPHFKAKTEAFPSRPPVLVLADNSGNIYDEPSLLMTMNRAGQWLLPQKGDLVPLPPESELFMLKGRKAIGFAAESGQTVQAEGLAVAGFASPGHTLTAHPAYAQEADAPLLPLFAYGAIGFADGQFWLAASKVDDDPRQQFAGIKAEKIAREAARLLARHPKNRLVSHIINNCVRRYACPAARNFALGRYEAPLPSATACNARCLGCISQKNQDSPLAATPQCRLTFTPTPGELAEVMAIHEQRERRQPIYSFGQGCEGDPLCNYQLLAESIARFRKLKSGGHGTVNCNSNGSLPGAIPELARAGLTSLRISLNSASEKLYKTYYRPQNYTFADVRQTMCLAREHGIFVSLNLLYFPGVTDTPSELTALAELCAGTGVSMVELRNLNIDPIWALSQFNLPENRETWEPALGLRRFMKELGKKCPWLRFGYFNPYLGDKAEITAPLPQG